MQISNLMNGTRGVLDEQTVLYIGMIYPENYQLFQTIVDTQNRQVRIAYLLCFSFSTLFLILSLVRQSYIEQLRLVIQIDHIILFLKSISDNIDELGLSNCGQQAEYFCAEMKILVETLDNMFQLTCFINKEFFIGDQSTQLLRYVHAYTMFQELGKASCFSPLPKS